MCFSGPFAVRTDGFSGGRAHRGMERVEDQEDIGIQGALTDLQQSRNSGRLEGSEGARDGRRSKKRATKKDRDEGWEGDRKKSHRE